MPTTYHTTAAYVSGAICGEIWMPFGARAGVLFTHDIRPQIERYSDPRGVTFRDVLLSFLTEHGGDFQNPLFTADTVIRVERRTSPDSSGSYSVHVFERELAEFTGADLADLVDASAYVSDFLGEID